MRNSGDERLIARDRDSDVGGEVTGKIIAREHAALRLRGGDKPPVGNSHDLAPCWRAG